MISLAQKKIPAKGKTKLKSINNIFSFSHLLIITSLENLLIKFDRSIIIP